MFESSARIPPWVIGLWLRRRRCQLHRLCFCQYDLSVWFWETDISKKKKKLIAHRKACMFVCHRCIARNAKACELLSEHSLSGDKQVWHYVWQGACKSCKITTDHIYINKKDRHSATNVIQIEWLSRFLT